MRARVVAAIAIAVASLGALPASASAVRVYDVVIDGLEPAFVSEATTPNISALLREGRATSYAAARAIMPAGTNPNHVAMMTGAYPERSGFVGNAWFDRESAERIDGEDAEFLQAETLFTAIERQQPGLVTAGIFGKPKLARIFADVPGTEIRESPDFLWLPCGPGGESEPPPGGTCGDDALVNPLTGIGFDDDVMDQVIETIDEREPDLTFINLPNVDQAGHGFTPLPLVYLAAIQMADEQVGRLVDHLKERDLWDDSVLLIHADHGMNTTAVKINLTAAYGLAGVSGVTVTAALGDTGTVSVVLDDPSRPDADTVLKRAREVALAQLGVDEALYTEPNPEDGGDAHTLDTVHPAWRLTHERTGDLLVTAEATAHFTDPSPDAPFDPLLGTHAHPTTRAVPYIVTGGSELVADAGTIAPSGPENEADDTEVLTEQAESVDGAPTIATMLGIDPPLDNQGRVLFEALSLPQSAGLARASEARRGGLAPARPAR